MNTFPRPIIAKIEHTESKTQYLKIQSSVKSSILQADDFYVFNKIAAVISRMIYSRLLSLHVAVEFYFSFEVALVPQ